MRVDFNLDYGYEDVSSFFSVYYVTRNSFSFAVRFWVNLKARE